MRSCCSYTLDAPTTMIHCLSHITFSITVPTNHLSTTLNDLLLGHACTVMLVCAMCQMCVCVCWLCRVCMHVLSAVEYVLIDGNRIVDDTLPENYDERPLKKMTMTA